MAAQKLVNLLALLSVALVACSFGPQPVNALAAHGAHINPAGHHALAAKKQRRADASSSKRCRKRPSSTVSLAHPTSSASFSSTKVSSSSSTEVKSSSAVTSSKDVTSTAEASSTAAATSSQVTSSKEVTSSSSQAQKTSSTEEKSSTSQTPTSTPAPKPTPTPKPTSNTPSSTHTSSSAVATQPAPAPNGSGKVGLAWPNGNDPSLPDYVTKQTGWIYGWSVELPSKAKTLGLNMIPMLWGAKDEADFIANAEANCVGGWMASFNEPNQPYPQSDLSPQDAAAIHKRAVQPMADKGYKIIAPATSSAPAGFQWVKDFFAACDGCHFDAIAIHYYDITPEGFIAYMEKWHNEWPNMQMFVTEFACQNFNGGAQCSSDQTWYFWSTAIKYMEAQPWITAYFGFGAMREMQGVNPLNQLMTNAGPPTSIGYTYINANW